MSVEMNIMLCYFICHIVLRYVVIVAKSIGMPTIANRIGIFAFALGLGARIVFWATHDMPRIK